MTWTGDEFPGNSLDAKWLWINQGSATATVANGQLALADASQGSDKLRFLYQAYSGSIIVTAALSGFSKAFSNYQAWGLAFRDSSSSKLIVPAFAINGGVPTIRIMRFTNATTFGGVDLLSGCGLQDLGGYLQVEDDSTNLIFRVGRFGSQGDGGLITFQELFRETRATYLSAADQIGFCINPLNSDTTLLCRWIRTGTPVTDTEVVV